MNAHTREAVTAIALFVFTLSALALPFIIAHFTLAFNKRLKRLDEALEIIEITNRYHDGKEEKS